MPAFQAIDQAGWTEQEFRSYDAVIKRDMDNLAVLGYQLEEAEVRGEARGEAAGEKKKARQIAQQMLANGLALEMVAKITGLPADEINKI